MNHHGPSIEGIGERIAAMVAVGGATSLSVSGVLDRLATIGLSIVASLVVGVLLELVRPRVRRLGERWSGELPKPAPALPPADPPPPSPPREG